LRNHSGLVGADVTIEDGIAVTADGDTVTPEIADDEVLDGRAAPGRRPARGVKDVKPEDARGSDELHPRRPERAINGHRFLDLGEAGRQVHDGDREMDRVWTPRGIVGLLDGRFQSAAAAEDVADTVTNAGIRRRPVRIDGEGRGKCSRRDQDGEQKQGRNETVCDTLRLRDRRRHSFLWKPYLKDRAGKVVWTLLGSRCRNRRVIGLVISD
jgi:hypothetical protein